MISEKEQHINSRSDVSGPSSSCTNITYEGDSVSTEQLRVSSLNLFYHVIEINIM